jgi:Di-haem oxidoreductase, putative peroxidase
MLRNCHSAAALTFFLVLGCKSDFDNVEVKRFPLNSDQSQVLQGLATIEFAIVSDWATAVANLRNAVKELKNNSTDIHLKSAQDLWKLARNLASGKEWRTAPLWGIGLTKIVNGHTNFLHDGRARNLLEAVMWHGGEAESSKQVVKKMSKAERNALIKFLESL